MRSAAALGLLLLASCGGRQENAPEPATVVATEAKPAATESARAPARPFQALGTEPFWSVEVLPGQLRYSHPGNIAGTTFAASEAVEGRGMRYSGSLDGEPFSLFVEPGTCSDGMSDTVYAWKASLTVHRRTEQGCARPAGQRPLQ